jgi:hypothetical protein
MNKNHFFFHSWTVQDLLFFLFTSIRFIIVDSLNMFIKAFFVVQVNLNLFNFVSIFTLLHANKPYLFLHLWISLFYLIFHIFFIFQYISSSSLHCLSFHCFFFNFYLLPYKIKKKWKCWKLWNNHKLNELHQKTLFFKHPK